jgi:transcriptional regulator with XRE-family HTH domain
LGVKKGQILTKPGEKKVLAAFGQKVREIRDKKKLSVYDVTGDDMPIRSRQHWQAIESGEKNINLMTLFRIAETLEVKPEELIKGLA